MSGSARLKIKYFGTAAEELVDLEETRALLDFEGRIILVEGTRVLSYADLVALAAGAQHQDKKYLEVVVLPIVMGG